MSPIDAVKSAFVNALKFRGRATRPEFWWYYLFTIIASVALALVDSVLNAVAGVGYTAPLFAVANLLISVTLLVRRAHDSGRSGWWVVGQVALSLLGAILMVFSVLFVLGAAFSGSGEVGAVALALVGLTGLCFLGSMILFLIIALAGSQPGPNKYGPPSTHAPTPGGLGYGVASTQVGYAAPGQPVPAPAAAGTGQPVSNDPYRPAYGDQFHPAVTGTQPGAGYVPQPPAWQPTPANQPLPQPSQPDPTSVPTAPTVQSSAPTYQVPPTQAAPTYQAPPTYPANYPPPTPPATPPGS